MVFVGAFTRWSPGGGWLESHNEKSPVSISAPLARRLGFVDAVTIGLASMIGAGVFVAFAPAAQSAGSWLLAGLGIAAIVALCNALSTAQLAAAYPSAGGAYLYGRERLGEWPGFLAGWGFVVGKTASCAAIALAFAAYVAPEGWERPIAAAATIALATVNSLGISRTSAVARVIVAFVIVVLALVVTAGFASIGSTDPSSSTGFPLIPDSPDPLGILQSAGLLFFAFAGFARVATLGEEVRDPARTIPRAILTSLAVVLLLYALLGIALLLVLGAPATAGATAPLSELVDVAGWAWAAPIVVTAAAVATLGSLLALLAGVSRTTLAMARHDDLPRGLAAVSSRLSTPVRAELLIAGIVSVLVLTVDLREVIGFSSFGVLLYYLVANASAFTQTGTDRRYPRAVSVMGALGCGALVVTLPWQSIVAGIAVLLVGVAYRLLRTRGML